MVLFQLNSENVADHSSEDQKLDQYISSGKPVLLFVTRPGCIFCEQLEPTLKEIREMAASTDVGDELAVAHIFSEYLEGTTLMKKKPLTIEGVPTIVVVQPNYEGYKEFQSSRTKEELVAFFQQHNQSSSVGGRRRHNSKGMKGGSRRTYRVRGRGRGRGRKSKTRKSSTKYTK